MSEKRERVCIVGGGITGLSCAWLLSRRGKFDVTVMERWGAPGLDAHNAKVPVPTDYRPSGTVTVDIPFRVFNRNYYRNLLSIFSLVGVEYLPVDYAGAYCTLEEGTNESHTFFTYRNLNLGLLSIPYIPFPNTTVLRIAWDYLYFCTVTPRHLLSGRLAGLTLGEYLDREGYSRGFARDVLLTALAVMCTCTYETMRSFPADLVVRCMATRANKGIQRAVGGNARIAARLSQYCDVRCDKEVESVMGASGPGTSPMVKVKGGDWERFDHVVLATQANQALRLLGDDASENEREALGLFRYESSSVTVHTDPRCMPRDKSEWRGVLFNTGVPNCEMPMATIYLNKVNSELFDCPVDIFQTWNPIVDIREDTVIAKADFERPVIDESAVRGMSLLEALNGSRGLWYCGSYAKYAMPLLENGVSAAMSVADGLGAEIPWPIPGEHPVKPWFGPSFFVGLAAAAGIASVAIRHRQVIVKGVLDALPR